MALDIQDAPAQEAAVAPLAERVDPYADWQKREGVKVIGGVYVRNLRAAELSEWPRMGVKGAIVYLDGDDQWDSQVVEIPPGGSTTPRRHQADVRVGRGQLLRRAHQCALPVSQWQRFGAGATLLSHQPARFAASVP